MRSLADSTPVWRSTLFRRALENSARAMAVVGVLTAILIVINALLGRQPQVQVQGITALTQSLVQWSTSERPQQIHARLSAVPDVALRQWLLALRGVGTQTSWEGSGLTPSGIAVEPIADPKHAVRVSLAAPAGTSIELSDAAGQLGTLRPRGAGGAVMVTPSLTGEVHGQSGTTTLMSRVRDTLQLRPVLLLGMASWEAKYLTAALEERGWKVDARFKLSPKQTVVQGSKAPLLDTEHYSVIIVLDGGVAKGQVAAITRYVRSGGGLILVGEAARDAAFLALAPARAIGQRIAPVSLEIDEPQLSLRPREALGLGPLTQLRDDAAPLEQRGHSIAVAIRRVGAGRVLQVGYIDTWKWRLAPRTASAPEEHRVWWAQWVSSVAYAPRSDKPLSAEERAVLDPAPLAALYSALGAPQPAQPSMLGQFLSPHALPWLWVLIMCSLVVEWTSRRLRGAP